MRFRSSCTACSVLSTPRSLQSFSGIRLISPIPLVTSISVVYAYYSILGTPVDFVSLGLSFLSQGACDERPSNIKSLALSISKGFWQCSPFHHCFLYLSPVESHYHIPLPCRLPSSLRSSLRSS